MTPLFSVQSGWWWYGVGTAAWPTKQPTTLVVKKLYWVPNELSTLEDFLAFSGLPDTEGRRMDGRVAWPSIFFIISIIKFPRQRRRKKQVDVKQQMNGQQRDFPLLIRKRLIILVGEIHRVTLEQWMQRSWCGKIAKYVKGDRQGP